LSYNFMLINVLYVFFSHERRYLISIDCFLEQSGCQFFTRLSILPRYTRDELAGSGSMNLSLFRPYKAFPKNFAGNIGNINFFKEKRKKDSSPGPTRAIKKKKRLVEGVVEEREFLEGRNWNWLRWQARA